MWSGGKQGRGTGFGEREGGDEKGGKAAEVGGATQASGGAQMTQMNMPIMRREGRRTAAAAVQRNNVETMTVTVTVTVTVTGRSS
jgi:hypothetical protein